MRTCETGVLLVGTEPGSGGCLDALNPRETRGTRIAPTPRPPVVGGASTLGDGAERRCLDALNPRGTRGARIAPQTPLRMDCQYASLACLRPLLNGRLTVSNGSRLLQQLYPGMPIKDRSPATTVPI